MGFPRILIIEDDEVITFVAKRTLSLRGYQVSVAADAREGLALAVEEKPHLILLDYMLPYKDGLSLLKDLRAELPNVIVIMITGSGNPEVVKRAIQNKVNDFLVKPFDISALIQRVQQWLPTDKPLPAIQSVAQPRTQPLVAIIDADTNTQQIAERVLCAQGYEVSFAANAADGLVLALREQPDLLLMDYLLPDGGGMSLLKDLHTKQPLLPIIIISDSGQSEMVKFAIQYKVKGFLIKPLTPEMILERVKQFLPLSETDPSESAAAAEQNH